MQLQDDQKQKDFQRKFASANRKMEEGQAAARAEALNVPYIDLSTFPVDLNAMATWSEQQCRDANAVVFFKEGNDMRVGTTHPESPVLKKLVEDLKVEKFNPSIYYISASSLIQMFGMFDKVVRPKGIVEETVEIRSGEDFKQALKNLETEQAIPATKILSVIFGAASSYGSSDVHIEPEENFIKVRFRIDGVLQDVLKLSRDYQKTIVSRVKLLSKLKLNVDNVPQDGRLSFFTDGKPTDVRVSILPSVYGEGIVMRILSNSAVSLRLDDLGFDGRSFELIKTELEKPNGMINTTGPTG
jgi:type IV pilus assembly protein PilB